MYQNNNDKNKEGLIFCSADFVWANDFRVQFDGQVVIFTKSCSLVGYTVLIKRTATQQAGCSRLTEPFACDLDSEDD